MPSPEFLGGVAEVGFFGLGLGGGFGAIGGGFGLTIGGGFSTIGGGFGTIGRCS